MAITQTPRHADIQRKRPDGAPAPPVGGIPAETPKAAVLGRLTWMLFGPFVLFLLAFGLFARGKSFFIPADPVFLAALGVTLLGRWVEFRSGAALTSTGEPATVADLRRYLVRTGILGIGLWGAAVLLRNFWLAG